MNKAKELAIEPEQTSAAPVAPAAKRRNWKTPSAVLAVIIILAALPIQLAGSYYMHILILAFIYCVISSAFRAISISGQFNIAQGAYMGIGAYVGGMCSVWLHFPPIADYHPRLDRGHRGRRRSRLPVRPSAHGLLRHGNLVPGLRGHQHLHGRRQDDGQLDRACRGETSVREPHHLLLRDLGSHDREPRVLVPLRVQQDRRDAEGRGPVAHGRLERRHQ